MPSEQVLTIEIQVDKELCIVSLALDETKLIIPPQKTVHKLLLPTK
jgi:hypothetical protein